MFNLTKRKRTPSKRKQKYINKEDISYDETLFREEILS